MSGRSILDKTNINTIVGIINTLVGITALYLALSGTINWYWVIWIFFLFGTLSLIYIRRRNFQKIINSLKPKPKLEIIVRDINCYVSTEFRQEDQNPGVQSHHIVLDIACGVKITNRSRTVATQVLGEMELTIEQEENTIVCNSKKTGHTYKLAKDDNPRQEYIVFASKYFVLKDFNYYPDASYYLSYVYQCRENPNKKLKTTFCDKLTKADWVGQKYVPEVRDNGSYTPAHWISDGEVLKLIRNLGYIKPS